MCFWKVGLSELRQEACIFGFLISMCHCVLSQTHGTRASGQHMQRGKDGNARGEGFAGSKKELGKPAEGEAEVCFATK